MPKESLSIESMSDIDLSQGDIEIDNKETYIEVQIKSKI